MSEVRSRRGGPSKAGEGNGRRTSQWQNARTTTFKAAAGAANALGRWFGVAGDDHAMEAMHQEYVRQKTMKRTAKAGGMVSENQFAQVRAAMAADSSSSDDDEEAEMMRVKHMTRNTDQALAHYEQIWSSQKKQLKKPRWYGGETKNTGQLDTIKPGRRHTHLRDQTMVAMQLQALPTFTPWFVYIVSLLQVLIFVGMMAHAKTKNSIAPFGLKTTEQTCTISPASNPPCPVDFNGVNLTVATLKSEHNYLYGPTTSYLVSVGAKFTLCMRSDANSAITLAKQRAIECGQAPNICTDSSYTGYSCCGLPNGRKGMRTDAACTADGGTWIYGAGMPCNEDTDFIVYRPCCAYHRNLECMLTTKDHCAYISGKWQEDKQLCSETLCLTSICQLVKGGYGIQPDDVYHNVPKNPNQWFRFFVPIFIHAGIIHVLIMITCQLYFGCPIETQAGFLRTFFIYMFSGFGGYVISGIFSSSTATVGCDPAVYGFIAVHAVELMQNWQIVLRPCWELIKMLGIVLISLGVGTLPYIDNWSHIGGFVFGLVAGIIFLPYINFGSWDLTRKRIMLLLAIPSLIVMTIIAFIYFYKVQSTTFCSWCKYIDCVPYTSAIDCGVQD